MIPEIRPGPCQDCPFRTDAAAIRLIRRRKEQIATALRQGAVFHCHKTVDYSYDEEGEEVAVQHPGVKACGGAMVVMIKDGTPNGPLQVAFRLGWVQRKDFVLDAPVHESLEEWIEAT